MKTLKENLQEALNESLNSKAIKEKETQFKKYAIENDLSTKIKTIQIPNEYDDDDIMDYLMEMTEDYIVPEDNMDKKVLKFFKIKDNVQCFKHWVDEDDYSEYITYCY